MKRNNLYLFIIVVFLLAISGYFFFSRTNSTLNSKQAEFAIDQNTFVNTIMLSNKTDTILLSWDSNNWKVDRNFNTRQEAMQNITLALTSVQIKAPVTSKRKKKVMERFNKDAIKIEILRNSKNIKSYFITEDTSGKLTYMMMEDEQKPFVVEIPGYRRNIKELYSLDVKYWRSNSIFKYNPNQLIEIKVEHINDPKSSFVLRRKETGFELKDSQGEVFRDFSQNALHQYLSYFGSVKFKKWATDPNHSLKDSLHRSLPEQILSVEDIDANSIIVKTYSNKLKDNVNDMFVLINNKDLVTVNSYEFKLLLKEISYFVFSTE